MLSFSQQQGLLAVAERAAALVAISAGNPTSAWAVGHTNKGMLIERWDGVRWTAVQSGLLPGLTGPYLEGVAAVDPRLAWAVGYAYNQHQQSRAIIERWNGTNWQQVPSPDP